jgi:hypothetical protein
VGIQPVGIQPVGIQPVGRLGLAERHEQKALSDAGTVRT